MKKKSKVESKKQRREISQRRREKLKFIAQSSGFDNWSSVETAIINGSLKIIRNNP